MRMIAPIPGSGSQCCADRQWTSVPIAVSVLPRRVASMLPVRWPEGPTGRMMACSSAADAGGEGKRVCWSRPNQAHLLQGTAVCPCSLTSSLRRVGCSPCSHERPADPQSAGLVCASPFGRSRHALVPLNGRAWEILARELEESHPNDPPANSQEAPNHCAPHCGKIGVSPTVRRATSRSSAADRGVNASAASHAHQSSSAWPGLTAAVIGLDSVKRTAMAASS